MQPGPNDDQHDAGKNEMIEFSERVSRAEVRLDQHQTELRRLEDSMRMVTQTQTMLAKTSADLANVTKVTAGLQATLANIECRQQKQSEAIYERLRGVELTTASNAEQLKNVGHQSGLFADWVGKILIPVVSALIATAGVVLTLLKFITT